jgi:cytochrome P450
MTADSFVFNPYGPAFDADPAPVYRHLQEHAPVHWWDRGRAFIVSRHADVVALMKDPRFSRSAADGRDYQPIPDVPEYHDFRVASDNSLFFVSPADHLRQRRLMNAAFSPRAIQWLREHTAALTRQALASLPQDEVVNLAPVADYIPLRVIGRLLAIPEDREESFLAFAQARIALLSPGLPPAYREQQLRLTAAGYTDLKNLISERRERPGEDLLSTLIHLEEEGTRVLESELLGMVGAIVVAGSDTSVHTLRFMLLDLLQNPESLERVRRDPALVRRAMEESLRFNNFSRLGAPLYALEDVTLHGIEIARGQTVFTLTAAAGRDPAVFVHPERYDLDRPDLAEARSFGVGPHTCLGIHLARLETEVAIPVILERFPTMTLAGPPVYSPHAFFRAIKELRVRVAPAA